MNPFSLNTFIAVGLVAGTGCSGPSAQVDDDVLEQAFLLPAADSYPLPPADDYNVDLTLRNESIDQPLMTQRALPQVIFTVWGYDELVADVSATQVKVDEFPLRPESIPYYIRFSNTDLQSVEFRSGQENFMKYYITVAVDVDGDGKICNGDFRQDYTQSRPERYPLSQNEISGEIAISEVSGEICSP